MLTDLHVHLRPDGSGSEAARYFTAENAATYERTARERGIDCLGVSEHIYRFQQALDVWQHPFWEQEAVDDLDAYCEFVRASTGMALGIEADYVPGRERELASLLDGRDFDYVIGSVHFVDDGAVDMQGEFDAFTGADAETVWRRYFELLAQAAQSGLFDIIAHPDLVKIWGRGRNPGGDLRRFYEPAADAIARSGVSVEVSTAGLRKPVGEIYPGSDLLALFSAHATPVVLSSDAHRPHELGYGYEQAVTYLRSHDINQVAVYSGRARRLEPLG